MKMYNYKSALCIMSYVWCVAILASCQKSDLATEVAVENKQTVTINLVADDEIGTRVAATDISQYIIEVYSDADYSTPLNLFEDGTKHQASSTDGTFNLILDRTVEHYCLFWADKEASAYSTATLKDVQLISGKTPAEAWFGTGEISVNNATQTIHLKRAVAKLNLKEVGAILAGTTLTAKFSHPTCFNVAIGGMENLYSKLSPRTETLTFAQAVNGTKENPVTLNDTDYFILSPKDTQYVTTITFKCGDETPFDISNVPFQANRATNVKGHYTTLASETFDVACDDDWTTPDVEEGL